MTTDRTQPARPAAPTDRSSAAPAEHRDGSAFAALLDAHAPAPRRDDRGPEPRDDAPTRDASVGPDHAPARDEHAGDAAVRREQPAAPETGPSQPVLPSAPAAQPGAIPPFVATLPAEVPAPAAPVLPAAMAPLFMLAPEAVASVVPPAPLGTAPELPVPPTGSPVAAPVQPAATMPAEVAAIDAEPQDAAPATPHAPVAQAPEAELPAEPVAPAEAPAAPEVHTAAPARAAATPEPAPAAAPSAQAPTAEPVAQAPVSTPLSGPVAPERTVPLHRAAAAVATLLHVAAERGITHARMALRPVELGGIEIRLQASAAGIAAQVVADSPEAARLLAQAGDDLRRALEARDVNLISLEVSTSSDQRQQQSARGEWSESSDSAMTSSGPAAGDTDAPPTTQTVIELPGGLLVDVLA